MRKDLKLVIFVFALFPSFAPFLFFVFARGVPEKGVPGSVTLFSL
jgi:hypothetical protein